MTNLNSVYAQRHYETAMDLFDQGQYDKALAQLDKAINKDPKNPDYYSAKGVFLHKMNDPVNAILAYKKALEVAPDHCFSHYNLGLIYMRQNKTLQAISEWEAVIKIKPRDVDAIFNIAVALSHLGKSIQAIPFFEKIVKIMPEHVQAHQNLGVIYRDMGEFTKAKRHLQLLRELDSTYVEVVESEITKCEEQEFLARLEAQKQAVETDGFAEGECLGNALMALLSEDYDKAQLLAETHLQAFADDVQAQLILGQAQQGLSKSSDAIATFMRIVAEHPEQTEALFNLGNLFLGLGELEKSLAYFGKVAELDPEYPFIKENIASIKQKVHSSESDDE